MPITTIVETLQQEGKTPEQILFEGLCTELEGVQSRSGISVEDYEKISNNPKYDAVKVVIYPDYNTCLNRVPVTDENTVYLIKLRSAHYSLYTLRELPSKNNLR